MIVPAHSLDASLVARWHELRCSNPMLDSPFFSPAFTLAVAAERQAVEVAVIESEGVPVGLLPYYRQRPGVATPIAGSFSGFQGLIARADTALDMRRVLADAGLSAWQFNQLVVGNDSLAPYHWTTSVSPFMDLSRGFEQYREDIRANAGKEMAEVLRKTRKLDREVGRVEFEPDAQSTEFLDTLITWKRDQLRRQRRHDSFRYPWVVPMLHRILHTQDGTFRPMLSVLHVGNEPIAITLGLRSGIVLHGWITAFNPAYRSFSPGSMLIVKLAQAAEDLGISRIDMGPGDESFKRRFCSGASRIVEGAVDRRLVAGVVNHSWVRAKEFLRGTAVHEPARELLRRLRYARGLLAARLHSGS